MTEDEVEENLKIEKRNGVSIVYRFGKPRYDRNSFARTDEFEIAFLKWHKDCANCTSVEPEKKEEKKSKADKKDDDF